jgi:uncharacterized protein
MGNIYKGRVVLPAELTGEALVTRKGFNTLACFYSSIITGARTAVCGDQDNPELYGQTLTDKIICLPRGIGSTSAGSVWQCAAVMDIAPLAMLFAETIDSLSAAGLVLADVWVNKRIAAVDRLGDEFLNAVDTGRRLRVTAAGWVEIL